MGNCLGHLQEAAAKREMLCDEDCEDYSKKCVIREHLDSPYCYYKKRKHKKLEGKA